MRQSMRVGSTAINLRAAFCNAACSYWCHDATRPLDITLFAIVAAIPVMPMRRASRSTTVQGGMNAGCPGVHCRKRAVQPIAMVHPPHGEWFTVGGGSLGRLGSRPNTRGSAEWCRARPSCAGTRGCPSSFDVRPSFAAMRLYVSSGRCNHSAARKFVFSEAAACFPPVCDTF
jgi:hypothetical protein